jgi:predicted extracellular nuclease
MLNACQAREVIALAEQYADPDAVVVIAGDLNAKPGEPTITAFHDAGYRDAQLAAASPSARHRPACNAPRGASMMR